MIATILTVTEGWQEASRELARQGVRFAIDGVMTFYDIAFCNRLATTYGFHVTLHHGLATFTKPVPLTPEPPPDSTVADAAAGTRGIE